MESSEHANPFPADPVATSSIHGLPDYRETRHYGEARALVEDFEEDFLAPSKRHHLALGLRGGFGSGKTHLVYQLIDTFTGGAGALELKTVEGGLAFAVYAKGERPSMLDLYRDHIARHLELGHFRTIVSNHLAKLLRLQRLAILGAEGKTASTETRSLTSVASQVVDDRLEQDPQLILALLQQDLLPVTDLPARVLADIRGRDAEFSSNFMRAYCQLLDEHADIALKWLKAQTLTSGEQKDLGLQAAAISSDQNAKAALRLLLGAFSKADVRVMLCIDEIERSTAGDANARRAGGNFIKDVAEIFMDAGQCLVLAGADKAWDVMTSDVFARTTRVVSVKMRDDELEKVLAAFARETLFELDALRLLLAIADGNPRRMLTMAHHALVQMRRALPAKATISERNVVAAAEVALDAPRRRDAVVETVKLVAMTEGFVLRAEPSASGVPCDLLLSRGKDVIGVFIMNSVFKLEELSGARAVARLAARPEGTSALSTVAIVTGYSTPEVRDALDQVVDRVFWYEESSFGTALTEFITDKTRRQSVHQQGADNASVVQTQFEKRLEDLEVKRKKEVEQLSSLLSDLQRQASRDHENARERRSADKIEQTLDALGVILESLEQQSAYTREWEEKLVEALALTRRLALLNRNLPDAEDFRTGLMQLESSLHQKHSVFERRTLLRHLETLHLSRGSPTLMDGVSRTMTALRRHWLTSVASLLTTAYVAAGATATLRSFDSYDELGRAVGRAQQLFDTSAIGETTPGFARVLHRDALEQRRVLDDAASRNLNGAGISKEVRTRFGELDGEIEDYVGELSRVVSNENAARESARSLPRQLSGIAASCRELRTTLSQVSTAYILVAYVQNTRLALGAVVVAVMLALTWSRQRSRRLAQTTMQ